MKRIVPVVTAALTVAVLSFPAYAQEGPRISLIHGIPDTPVDVEVEGTLVFTNLVFGETRDLTSLAGATLTAFKVKLAGTTTDAIDAADLGLPASGNHSIIVHLDPNGSPALSIFENDTSAIAAGHGRVAVRHTAAAPVVDVLVGGSLTFSNLSNPHGVSADFPVSLVSVSVVPAGANEPILIGPADLNITDGQALNVYAVGSQVDETLQVLTETLADLGTAPTGVETGNSPVGVPGAPWALALAGAILGAFVLRKALVRDRG